MKTWFITGAANGLGRAIAEVALNEGANVAVAIRKPARVAELVEAYGPRIAAIDLDVTDRAKVSSAVAEAIEHFGAIDVLVNNAGYTRTAAFEQLSADDFDSIVDTNFFGTVNLTRAVLPHMRERGSGHIINISSAGGRVGLPSQTAYCAAKAAVGAFTEALAQEIDSFGVRTVSIEPGSLRTNFGHVALRGVPEPMEAYSETAGAFRRALAKMTGNEIGDIRKVARVIVGLTERDDLPSHLILGSDALAVIRATERKREQDAAAWETVSRSTDADDADFSWLADVL